MKKRRGKTDEAAGLAPGHGDNAAATRFHAENPVAPCQSMRYSARQKHGIPTVLFLSAEAALGHLPYGGCPKVLPYFRKTTAPRR